jgi:hypothetical protein
VSEESGFLSRWSRRKTQARQGAAPEEPTAPSSGPGAPPAPIAPAVAVPLPEHSVDTRAPPADAAPPAPTMDDVTRLTRESDFSRFVAPGVDGEVKNAALKKLFGDPHFNVMDGLDVYIDDYSKPDPLPLASIRKMAQAAFLGLVESTPPAAKEPGLAAGPQTPLSTEGRDTPTPEPDEDADLRLQPHNAAGRGGAEDGAAPDERRQS